MIRLPLTIFFVCLLNLWAFAQGWEAMPLYASNAFDFTTRMASLKGKVYHTKHDGHIYSFNGKEWIREADLVDSIKSLTGLDTVQTIDFLSVGDSMLYMNLLTRGNNIEYYHTLSFNGESLDLVTSYRRPYLVNQFSHGVVKGAGGVYFMAGGNSYLSSGKEYDSLILIKLSTNGMDTLGYFTNSSGQIDGASDVGVLIRGDFTSNSGQNYSGYYQLYISNGMFTQVPSIFYPSMILTEYTAVGSNILFTTIDCLFCGNNNPQRFAYLFNGTSYTPVGNTDWEESYMTTQIDGRTYLTARNSNGSNHSTSFIYEYVGNTFVKQYTDDTLEFIDNGAKINNVVKAKDYLYISGRIYSNNGLFGPYGLLRRPLLNQINNAPLAYRDTLHVTDTTSYSLSVNANDTDPDGDYVHLERLTDPLKGTAHFDGNEFVHYQANLGASGLDSIQYRAHDVGGLSDTSWVIIVIDQVGQQPELHTDFIQTDENTNVNMLVLQNDNLHGESYTLSILDSASHGELTILSDGTIDYLPEPIWFGQDSFQYEVCKTYAWCDSVWSFIDVDLVNFPPVAEDDYRFMTGLSTNVNVLGNDSDPDGDTYTFSVLSGPFSPNASIAVNIGSITYSNANAKNEIGDSVFYELQDFYGEKDSAWIRIEFNQAPVASEDFLSFVGTQLLFDPTANDFDPEGQNMAVSILSGPFHSLSSAVVCGSNCIQFDHQDNSSNFEDSIEYVVYDQYSHSDTSWIYVSADFTGLSEKEAEVKVFPNPASDFIVVSIAAAGNRVSLYDAQGKLVFDRLNAPSELKIETSNLTEGAYILHVQSETHSSKHKVAILKYR